MAFARNMDLPPMLTGEKVNYFWQGVGRWVDIPGACTISPN